jgi:hypothetical protein
VQDDMTLNLRILEPRAAVLQAPHGVVLGDLLARRVVLAGVTHVGQGQLAGATGQHLAQGKGVVVVGRPVIGDDELCRHDGNTS